MCKLCKYIPHSWSSNFKNRLFEIAKYLGTKPDFILAVIKHESGFNTQAINYDEKGEIEAVGLIQFHRKTLRNWGYSVYDILNMNELEQLDLIKKYYSPYKNKGLDDPIKLFVVTFYPVALNHWHDNSWILGSEISINYAKLVAKKNSAFDLNKDNFITIKEVKRYYKELLKKEGLYGNKKWIFFPIAIITIKILKKWMH